MFLGPGGTFTYWPDGEEAGTEPGTEEFSIPCVPDLGFRTFAMKYQPNASSASKREIPIITNVFLSPRRFSAAFNDFVAATGVFNGSGRSEVSDGTVFGVSVRSGTG